MELPEQAQRILSIVKAAGGVWVDRREIAKALGKNRLNPGDLAYLDVLAANSIVETEQRKNNTPIGYEVVYRAK